MQDMIQIFKENKVVLVAVFVLILMFIGWSVWQYSNTQARQVAIEQESEESKAATEEAEQNNNEEAEDSNAELTERQKDIIAGYTAEEEEFIALLSANIWQDPTEKTTLVFTKNTYAEGKGEERQTRTFAVASLVEDKITGEGSTYEGYVAALETDNGTFIVKLQRWVTAEGKIGTWKITSDSFALAKEYSLSKAATNFKLESFDKEAAMLFGSEKELTEAMTKYVAATYPSATTGTWNGKVEMDWSSQVVKTWFNLDTKTSTQITVTYRMDTGEIEVS